MSEPTLRPVPDGLVEAFHSYERALMADDVAELDRLFAPGPTTLRGDAAGLLVGHDRISAFRGARGGAPKRVLKQTHVQVIDDDHALVVAVTELARGGRGQQTQLWARTDDGWKVSAAHVSVPPPALDTRVWRVVGNPLLPGAPGGPLAGESVAVKDLFAVAGQRVGAGNPAWLAGAPVEDANARSVQALLDAGADVVGVARTDELAYSLAGTNAHYGTPPNPRAPYRISGGSTSGPATAVSLGQATIALGTDTGGSVRVPGAYQGLFGIRTTHDAVDRTGLLPLAPSFDTVGWLARSASLLRRVSDVLLPDEPPGDRTTGAPVLMTAFVSQAEPDVAEAVGSFAAGLGLARDDHAFGRLDEWRAAFQTWQAWEAWRAHGEWLTTRLDTLGDDVRGRFAHAAGIDEPTATRARTLLDDARGRVLDVVGDRVLVLPSASSVAPLPGAGLQAVREATLRLTCVAGIGGLPALTLPLTTRTGLPCGVCLVAAPGRDRDLLHLAESLSGPETTPMATGTG